jgi:hypothetical protein
MKDNEDKKPPIEIPMKEKPYNPQPEKDPNVKNIPKPSENNPVNPKEDR